MRTITQDRVFYLRRSWVKTAFLQQKFEDHSLAVDATSISSLPLQESREGSDTRLFSQINVEVNGHDEAVLESYSQFVRRAAKILNIDISGRIALPIKRQRFTLLKSPHIYKKHRVQYEIRTHRRLLQLHQLTGETADVFLEYIQRNLPEGVSMKVEQVELEELDVEIPVDAQTYFDSKNK